VDEPQGFGLLGRLVWASLPRADEGLAELLGRLVLPRRPTPMVLHDPDGDAEVLEAFWQFEFDWPHPELVPPLLIYADLLATGDARNLETARIIYEQELAGLIREN